MSRSAIGHRLETKRWHRVHPSVYATFPGDLSQYQRELAALLWAQSGVRDQGAMLTGASALRAFGCRYAEDPRTHLLVSTVRPLPADETVILTRTRQLPEPAWLGQRPLAPAARATIDALSLLPDLRSQRAVACEAVHRGLTSASELSAALGTRGGGGLTLTRRVLDDIGANCWSAPECEFRDLVATSRVLPEPRFNLRLSEVGGPTGVIADAVWAEGKLIVEIDSVDFHGDRDSAEATATRRNHLIAAGWLVIDVTPGRLRREPAAFLAVVERAYLGRIANR